MRFKRSTILILAVCLLFALLSGLFAGRVHYYGMLLESQKAAERWRGGSDMRFAQISCFRPVGQELGQAAIKQFRAALDPALSEASLETTENMNLWVDAYSAQMKLRVQGEKTTIEADAYAVGGQYFFFHPLKLLSGSYFAEEDLSHDRVVLTRELAWALFGAVDLAGMTVVIDGKSYQIAGVVDPETDSASKAARDGGMALYLHYDQAYAYSDEAISCYELVLADPIRAFAKNTVTDHFPELGEVIENSARYELSQIWSLVSEFGTRSMNVSGILYPPWENAARYTEDHMALYLVLAFLTALPPAGFVVTVAVYLIRHLKVQGKRVANRLRNRYE